MLTLGPFYRAPQYRITPHGSDISEPAQSPSGARESTDDCCLRTSVESRHADSLCSSQQRLKREAKCQQCQLRKRSIARNVIVGGMRPRKVSAVHHQRRVSRGQTHVIKVRNSSLLKPLLLHGRNRRGSAIAAGSRGSDATCKASCSRLPDDAFQRMRGKACQDSLRQRIDECRVNAIAQDMQWRAVYDPCDATPSRRVKAARNRSRLDGERAVLADVREEETGVGRCANVRRQVQLPIPPASLGHILCLGA